MGRHETMVPFAPPAIRAPTVIRYLQVNQRTLVEIEARVPALLLAVAEKQPGALVELAATREEIAQIQFEIEHGAKARELAAGLDQAAFQDWKKAVQTLPPEQIVEGISKEGCCRRCVEGSVCAITGADIYAGGACAHPIKAGALAAISSRDNPKVVAVFAAACSKLGKTFR
jgi:hypothetical protein